MRSLYNLRTLYIIYFCLVVVPLAFIWAPSVWRLGRITADPVSTGGRVVNIACQRHEAFVEYSFVVDGVSHRDRSSYGMACRFARIGQDVAVSYERGRPENSYGVFAADAAGDPVRNAFLLDLLAGPLALFLGPLLAAYLELWKMNQPLPRPTFPVRLWIRLTGREHVNG